MDMATTDLNISWSSLIAAAVSSVLVFAADFGWITILLGILYLIEARSLKAWGINAGYCIVAPTVMDIGLSAW